MARINQVQEVEFGDFTVDLDMASGPTQEELAKQALLQTLEKLGQFTTGEDSLVFEGTRIVLPASMRGDVKPAVDTLREWQKAQEAEFDFSRTYNYRPYDGANAFQIALKEVFGTTGLGVATQTMFGPIPPAYVSVPTGVNSRVQVPWGKVELKILDATFDVGHTRHADYGAVFQLTVTAKKKFRPHIEAFMDHVQTVLKKQSIYRGKAVNGDPMQPGFLPVDRVKREQVVYSDKVFDQLLANVWTPIRYTDKLRDLGVPIKRAVLLAGPYGTGKSLAGALTAQEAVANGWTFILCRPGKDDLFDVLRTAQLYAPAVVQFEDIDTVDDGDDVAISKLLDALDSISNKGNEVMALFTTNHLDRIQKGVLRPGRLDAVIEIEGLDRNGVEKLIKVIIPPEHLDVNVDYDQVYEAMKGYLPAFLTEALNRATRYTLAHNQGEMRAISTEDLVSAATGLRPQLDLMNVANEGATGVTLDALFTKRIEGVVNKTELENGPRLVVVSEEDNR